MERRYPEVRLLLREYSHSQLIRRFLDGELDAIFNFGSEAMPPEVESLVLRRDHQCVVVPPHSPLALERSLRMEDLKGEKFIAMARSASQPGHDFLWRITAEAGFVPEIVAEVGHVPHPADAGGLRPGDQYPDQRLRVSDPRPVTFVPLVGVPLSSHSLSWRRGSANPSLPLLVDTVRDFLAKK